jgi:phage/plasmid-like protein (TIGR03299 family)
LGKSVENAVTAEEAIKLADLDWEVRKVPMLLSDETFAPVPDAFAIKRVTDNKILGTVGNQYAPIQNRNQFNFFDCVIGKGQAKYETAGSLVGGKRVWILAKMPGQLVVGKDDVTEKYLLLSSSHDGSSPLYVFWTPIRVVCQNTLNMAMDKRAGRGIAIRHTASAELRMTEAEKVMDEANKHYAKFGDFAQHLAGKQYNVAQLKALVEELFPAKNDGEFTKQAGEKRSSIIRLFETGKGVDNIRGTAWAALQAVAEYADHEMNVRKADSDKRTFNAWFGGGQVLKQQAMDFIGNQMAA